MSDDNNQPDLDLINRVQKARIQHDETARPSDYAAVYWIEAKQQEGNYPLPTANTGEWRINIMAEAVDSAWEKIKTATKSGRLGYKSKVSTRPAAGQAHPDERLICVRTYDVSDTADVARIKQVLIDMGFDPAHMIYVHDKRE